MYVVTFFIVGKNRIPSSENNIFDYHMINFWLFNNSNLLRPTNICILENFSFQLMQFI